jgi:hypothetical protein
MPTLEPGLRRIESGYDEKALTLAPFVLMIAVLTLSIALADRMKERALHDRFSFDDSGTAGIGRKIGGSIELPDR